MSYDDPGLMRDQKVFTSGASPFVIAVKNARISALPSILNGIILITILSVANSSSYNSSRVLSAMADEGMAPKVFKYIDKKGRPLAAFALSLAFGLLSYIVNVPSQDTVFNWLLALCGLSSVVSWASICLTHIYFRAALKVKAMDPESLPYRSQFGVLGSYIGLVCNLLIIVCQFFAGIFPIDYHGMTASLRAQSAFEAMMFIPLLIAFYLLYGCFRGTKRVVLKDVDFSDTWTDDDWKRAYRRDHPQREGDGSWVPLPIRTILEAFAFPW